MKDFDVYVLNRKKDSLSILFVCASNICRSPYAEYLMKRLVGSSPVLDGKVSVSSAAVFNRSSGIFPRTREMMLKEGWSRREIDAHRPVYKRDAMDRFIDADIIIGMTRFQKLLTPFKAKFITLSEAADRQYFPVKDPWLALSQDQFEADMRIIGELLPLVAKRLELLI